MGQNWGMGGVCENIPSKQMVEGGGGGVMETVEVSGWFHQEFTLKFHQLKCK